MSVTRQFKETIQARIARDPAFREELLNEGVDCLLAGDVETGKAVLRDYVNATIGFQQLGRLTAKSPKSLIRMLRPGSNPHARNLFEIVVHLQKNEGRHLKMQAARKAKHCRLCQETIHLDAVKCAKCQSYQDWRRYLTIGNTAFALLVALITVVTVAGPHFIDAIIQFLPPRANIRATITSSYRQEQIFMRATNTGPISTVFGAHGQLILLHKDGENDTKEPVKFETRESDHHHTIEPGHTQVFFVYLWDSDNAETTLYSHPEGFKECHIEYTITTTETHRKTSNRVPFECPRPS